MSEERHVLKIDGDWVFVESLELRELRKLIRRYGVSAKKHRATAERLRQKCIDKFGIDPVDEADK